MEIFSALLALCARIHRSPVNSPHKGQWRGALLFYLICAWINGWVNNREAGNLRRDRGHYDVTIMWYYAVIRCNYSSSRNSRRTTWGIMRQQIISAILGKKNTCYVATGQSRVGATKPIHSLIYFVIFPVLQNHQNTHYLLNITFMLHEYKRSWTPMTRQIWIWFKESSRYFSKTKKFPDTEIKERNSSKPHPDVRNLWALGQNIGPDRYYHNCLSGSVTLGD